MELIDREPLLKKWGNGCGCEDDCHGDCSECAFPGAVDDVQTAPTIDAVPVEEIETYRKMWLARADKLRNSIEGVAYSAMAYAAKVMLYSHEVSKHLQPPGADAKKLTFKKWTLFDNADPEEEKE